MAIQQFKTEWGGRELIIETGHLAKQTNGSCTVQYGGTVVLATAVIAKSIREGIDYFPLMVDFEEKLYAAGKIKGSRFIKRETRPSDDAILTARLIDRSLRPLFDERIRNDVQVILTTLSFDTENDVDIVSLVAASCALAISDIPWDGPIGGIRVGQIPSEDETKKEWVLNPTYEARAKSILDLVVSGTPDKVLMIEAGASEVDEATMADAIAFGQKHMREVIDLITEVQSAVGAQKRIITDDEDPEVREEKAALKDLVSTWAAEHVRAHLLDAKKLSKIERKEALEVLKNDLDLHLQEKSIGKDKRKTAFGYFERAVEHEVSRAVLEEEKRVDGRALDEIRPLGVEVGLLPRTHGSAVFSRGDTQILSIVTLGAPSQEQTIEGLEENSKKRYMHHYNFPPYSVGEVSPLRGAGRREIGHGALAEKAIVPMLPDRESFPYTIRVVSEVLSSNGSSSMGSTCGSSLALMDAGVPIKKPVAGIAMGLATNDKGDYKILTDLQDLEDGPGGMDFKVAGSIDGITAIQLDTKTKGLSSEIVRETLERARTARLQILETMGAVIPTPRQELSQYAPRIITMRINPDRIRDVIGPGGKVINEIIDKTGVTIDIEDDGLIMITSTSPEAAEKAVDWIRNLTREVVVGETFQGKVTRILDFGAFVEILPRQEGLIHISELAPYRVRAVTDIVKVGMMVPVKVVQIDEQGRINLSLKQTDYTDYPPAPTGEDFAVMPPRLPHRQAGRPFGDRPRRGPGGPRRPRF